jgi:uncharacterized protein with HEPN domain
MRLESKKLLLDMQKAADLIGQFVTGKHWEDFAADVQLRSAVERQFEILGEALMQLNKADAPVAARITDYRKIIGFRNVLIHGYAKVNNAVTWQIVEAGLPVLARELAALLTEPDDPIAGATIL